MKYKAVIFDLFETLITEWGHKKYTKAEMSADLGIAPDKFDTYWEENENERYIGNIDFAESIRYVCEKCGTGVDDTALSIITEKRVSTKSVCFEYVDPDVFGLLDELKARGIKLAIVSNCSSEEVWIIRQSRIYPYFDEVILSYEVRMQKPDRRIYETAAERLGVSPDECVFVGDGGSHELQGARSAGMTAVQAKWYTDKHPYKRESIEGFPTADKPLEVLRYVDE